MIITTVSAVKDLSNGWSKSMALENKMIVVDSCKLVVDGMYIFREVFRLLAVLINQLSKSGKLYRGE